MPEPTDLGAAVAVERDRVIHRLSNHFALDVITIDELDRRIEQAYRARSVEELRGLIADLEQRPAAHASPTVVPAPYDARGALLEHEEYGRIAAVMSNTKRAGLWIVPRNLVVRAIMSETKLDLREARLAPGVTDIDVFAFWAAVRITVPPGVRVVDHTEPIMAEVRNESLGDTLAGTSPSILRVRGSVIMAELVIKTQATGR
ncbi:MAG TPA: DUF1707 domain-containing protein [Gemmatimonadaceae bacterium]|nr:DUF1707 domain-containing protein [Gemmatimonadaceae bacterium]